MTAQWDYNKPYADAIAVAISYFHPNTRDAQAIEDLHHFASLDPMPDWFQDFKTQLAQALENHLEGMDLEEFEREVQPNARTNEIYLRRIWATVFPDEPIPGEPSEPWDAAYTLADIYLGDREPDENLVHPDHLRRQFQRPDSELTPLVRTMKDELAHMLQGDFDGLDLKAFRSRTAQYYLDIRRDDKDFARHAWQYLFPDQPMPES